MTTELVFTVAIMGFIGYILVSWVLEKIREKLNFRSEKQNWNNNDEHEQASSADRERRDPHWSNVLEVSVNAGVDEIKRAYRARISRYHPDKVSALGPEFQEIAERKSKEINKAYDAAKRERQFS